MNEAGLAVRRKRKQLKLTQKDLADRCGMAQSDISRVESMDGNPSVRMLKRIADAMHMKLIVEFRDYESNPKQKNDEE